MRLWRRNGFKVDVFLLQVWLIFFSIHSFIFAHLLSINSLLRYFFYSFTSLSGENIKKTDYFFINQVLYISYDIYINFDALEIYEQHNRVNN